MYQYTQYRVSGQYTVNSTIVYAYASALVRRRLHRIGIAIRLTMVGLFSTPNTLNSRVCFVLYTLERYQKSTVQTLQSQSMTQTPPRLSSYIQVGNIQVDNIQGNTKHSPLVKTACRSRLNMSRSRTSHAWSTSSGPRLVPVHCCG